MNEPLIEVKDLRVEFDVREGTVKAVDGFNLTIRRGETVGVIGESDCGKSVTARAILAMIPKPGKVTGGQILYHRPRRSAHGNGHSNGHSHAPGGSEITEVVDLTKVHPDGETIRQIRGGEIGMIFQEPMSSLNPILTVEEQIVEVLMVHREMPRPAQGLYQDMVRICPLSR